MEGQFSTQMFLEVEESPYQVVSGQISIHILSLEVAYAQLPVGHD